LRRRSKILLENLRKLVITSTQLEFDILKLKIEIFKVSLLEDILRELERMNKK